MKKNLVVCVCLFILTVPVFGQTINKAEYKAIDPFDYKLDEDKARRGTQRKFKSVVEFVYEGKENNTTFYEFISLDKRTLLRLIPNPDSKLRPPSPGQTVTVYYSVRKLSEDERILDMFEDNRNKDERGLGVEKSPILQSSPGVRRSDYGKVSAKANADEVLYTYEDDAFYTHEDDDVRKFFILLKFVSQEGIFFNFLTLSAEDIQNINNLSILKELFPDKPEFADIQNINNPSTLKERLISQKLLGKQIAIKMKVGRRYPTYTAGQIMRVYFSATKEAKDYLRLDDIVVMN